MLYIIRSTHLEDHHSEAEYVHTEAILLVEQHLRSHVLLRAADRHAPVARQQAARTDNALRRGLVLSQACQVCVCAIARAAVSGRGQAVGLHEARHSEV